MAAHSDPPERTYHIFGVPLRSGSLYPGNENDASGWREANLVARLEAAGHRVIDRGDVPIPTFLPHHQIPPVRSWPGPRIAWEAVATCVLPCLRERGQVPLLIGCDCSVVVGTTLAASEAGHELHVLYVDGDMDAASPDATRCQSAAALALWLVTQASPFRPGPMLKSSQITVLGWSHATAEEQRAGFNAFALEEVRRCGPAETARRALAAIPTSASILVHFDVDVFREQDFPAAYFPHEVGLSIAEVGELMNSLLADPRIVLIEVWEYAALRDHKGRHVSQLIELLAGALK